MDRIDSEIFWPARLRRKLLPVRGDAPKPPKAALARIA